MHWPHHSSNRYCEMGTIGQNRKARLQRGASKHGDRSRAARVPDYQMAAIVPMWLFSLDDVRRLSADAVRQDRRLQARPATDLELTRITQCLRHAFDWAVQCDHMQKWRAEPQRVRKFYEQVARHADNLLEALNLNPEECRDVTKPLREGFYLPAIAEFRGSLDIMARARPILPDELDRLSRVAWDELSAHAEGDGIDAEGYCQYRARASFLIDRLPRTLALLGAMAQWKVEQLKCQLGNSRDKSDPFSHSLFKVLASAHELIFERKPVTRGKTGHPIGGSIDWARAVIRHAADAIEASPYPAPFRANGDAETIAAQEAQYLAQARAIAAPYIARFRGLADLSNRSISDLLDRGWHDWKAQVTSAAR